MTLTTRLSLFFLGALAFVLASFSIALYFLAQSYLYRQLDERLTSAVHILAAAVEVEPGNARWDPEDRELAVGQEAGPDQVHWLVRDAAGKVIDHSAHLPEQFVAVLPHQESEAVTAADLAVQAQAWRVHQRRITAPQSAQTNGKRSKQKNPFMVVTAGASLEPVQATLHRLGLALTGLSLGVWLTAAALGRWFCRRALLPVRRMASAAREIDAASMDQRLPAAECRDELGELGTSFNELLGRLQEAFERQRRFTGDASHQLRTPLTAMLGQLEVTLRRERSADEYRDVLVRLTGQAGQLRQIVEMLLFLARADAEAKLPTPDPLDLAAWLPEHLGHWSAHARHADFQLEAVADSSLRIRASAPLLGQLLDNLLENACKYSAAGTPISIRLSRTGRTVSLEVEDRGCGIAGGDLPHLFEPFYRAAEVRRRGIAGVGLGLAVARRIAGAFGGTIEAHSEERRGTRFTLQLPLAEDAPADQRPGQAETVAAGHEDLHVMKQSGCRSV
jgi:two-component system OmpR family sensor kinase